MSKKLPERYVNEKAVKRALGIDSFRKVSKDKMGTRLLWAVGSGFAAIGAGIGIYSAFGGGDSLPQVSGDEEDR